MVAPVASADSGPVSSCPENADKTLTVAAGTTAPAGIVRIAGEELLEAIESEEDIVKANMELLEGRALTAAEQHDWAKLFRDVQRECNKRLKPVNVFLAACCPEPNGLGACFSGVDSAARVYDITLTLPAKERADFGNAAKEDFVRWAIDQICTAVAEKRREYLARGGMAN